MVQLFISCALIAGALSGVFSLWRSRRACNDQLRELREELEKAQHALKKRGDLAHEVAHEIKNPITAILCSAEALDLLIGDSLDPCHRKSLRYIKEYGDCVLRLISDFLDLSMIEANVKSAHPRHVDLFAAVESVIGLLESYALKRHVIIRHEPAVRPLAVLVDPKHLRQILFNLIHNAIKFSLEGGEVRVVSQDTFPGKFVKLSVKDAGCGIPEEDLDHVFNPYWHDARRREGGHGLGLALTKSLVELAGGRISVVSQQGVGTCFDVHIPESAGREESLTVGLSPEDAERIKPLLGYSFLLLDEDKGARESAAALIEAWGGMVDDMSAAVDAVRALGEHEYHAVVVDASCAAVADDSGINQALDARHKTSTHIILTSRDRVSPETMETVGARHVLEKPFNGRILLRSLLETTRGVLKH